MNYFILWLLVVFLIECTSFAKMEIRFSNETKPTHRLHSLPPDIHNFQGVGAEDFKQFPACTAKQTVFLRTPNAVTRNGQWEELDQELGFPFLPIVVERCSAPGNPCIAAAEGTVSTMCVQEYLEITVKFKNNATEVVKVPSACACTLPENRYDFFKYEINDDTRQNTINQSTVRRNS